MIVLEPCYDSYIPNIALAGATAVCVPHKPGTYRLDSDRLADGCRHARAPSGQHTAQFHRDHLADAARLAAFMANAAPYLELGAFYQAKRDKTLGAASARLARL